jgi:hypothetical protein
MNNEASMHQYIDMNGASKPKCMLIVNALARPLLQGGAKLTKAMLLHFSQLGCLRMFKLLPFWPRKDVFFFGFRTMLGKENVAIN